MKFNAKIAKIDTKNRASIWKCKVIKGGKKTIIIDPSRKKKLKNNSVVDKRTKILTQEEITNMFRTVFAKNTELTKCISYPGGIKTYKNTGEKKTLVYNPR